MADYGLVPSFELPPEFQGVWNDITMTDFQPEKAGAVVIFPGLLDPDVGKSLVNRWLTAAKPFINVFVAGIHTPEGQEQMRGINATFPDFATWQFAARHTPDQAVWTIRWLKTMGLKSVALYAPQFHVTRATMTLVKAAVDAGWEGKIHPFGWHPGTDKLSFAGFDNAATHDELIPGEQTRWVNYTEKGDIAVPSTWAQFRPVTATQSVSQMFADSHYGSK